MSDVILSCNNTNERIFYFANNLMSSILWLMESPRISGPSMKSLCCCPFSHFSIFWSGNVILKMKGNKQMCLVNYFEASIDKMPRIWFTVAVNTFKI